MSSVVAPAHGALHVRPYDGPVSLPGSVQGAQETSCDDGTVGGTLVQRLGDWYGNDFLAACGGGRITGVRFQHLAYGLPGPYLYRLHLVDGSCNVLQSTPVLETPAGDGTPTWVEVDLADSDWCVQGNYGIFLEPLSCADPMSGSDCFPALAFDDSNSPDPGAHCARVNTQGTFDRTCASARSADGRYFDFVLRPELACDEPACTTAVEAASWSLIKQVYRQP